MNSGKQVDSLLELLDAARKKAPEYFDLLTASSNLEFETAFDAILDRAIRGIEANGKNFQALGEVGISGALCLAINMPGLSATQETNSNGHVDLTITADHCVPARKKLGEAKIWGGVQYHLKGLSQLVTRYSTGRETRGLIVEYFKTRNIAGLMEKLKEEMDKERPNQQVENAADYVMKWSFTSTHKHSSGEKLEVAHVGCNLFIETTGN